MIESIESGEVSHVLVKDLSRVGRDYLQVGFYTEVMFRENGVRFIAIANGVDSDKRESSEFAPFLNIMNEWYVRDSSRKITTVLRAKGNSQYFRSLTIPTPIRNSHKSIVVTRLNIKPTSFALLNHIICKERENF